MSEGEFIRRAIFVKSEWEIQIFKIYFLKTLKKTVKTYEEGNLFQDFLRNIYKRQKSKKSVKKLHKKTWFFKIFLSSKISGEKFKKINVLFLRVF